MPELFNPQAFEKLAKAEAAHWWFRSRNRLLIWALREKVGSFRNFLEVGCGTGFVLSGIHDAFPEVSLKGSNSFQRVWLLLGAGFQLRHSSNSMPENLKRLAPMT